MLRYPVMDQRAEWDGGQIARFLREPARASVVRFDVPPRSAYTTRQSTHEGQMFGIAGGFGHYVLLSESLPIVIVAPGTGVRESSAALIADFDTSYSARLTWLKISVR